MIADLRYLARLLRAVVCPELSWRRAAAAAPLLAVAVLGAVLASGSVPAASAAERSPLEALEQRAVRVSAALRGVEGMYAAEVAPLERVLLGYRDDRVLARRVAVALLREGRATGVSPELLLALLTVENPWLDPGAVSPVGARGLMQVMPLHRGKWRGCAPRLLDVDGNICHGARIFANYLKTEHGDVERALLRYNGCVHGTNTPDCRQYATHVLARLGRTSLAAAE